MLPSTITPPPRPGVNATLVLAIVVIAKLASVISRVTAMSVPKPGSGSGSPSNVLLVITTLEYPPDPMNVAADGIGTPGPDSTSLICNTGEGSAVSSSTAHGAGIPIVMPYAGGTRPTLLVENSKS